MKGSYYKAMLKEKKSKKKATKATKAAMKGTSGFYGFKLRGKNAKYIPARNGTLIWARKEGGKKNATEASSTHNILYSSRSFRGNRKVVVSGTVMVPKGNAPDGGWPVISWAHGTVGLADQCAPSRRLGASYYGSSSGELFEGWLEAGYAIVATDYEGLGTPGIHPYLIGESEGRGVLDMVLAARQLDGTLSKRVALAGHSQGGQAILWAANLATTRWGAGAEYLGTVSYAPASNLEAQANNLNQEAFKGQYGISALALTIVKGMTVGNPRINANALLRKKARPLYRKTTSLCQDPLTEQLRKARLSPADLFIPNWNTTDAGGLLIEELKKQNPDVTVGAPVLIPQGEKDTTVFPALTNLLVNQLEKKNTPPGGLITYEVFPGADHQSILRASSTVVDQFIGSLFNP